MSKYFSWRFAGPAGAGTVNPDILSVRGPADPASRRLSEAVRLAHQEIESFVGFVSVRFGEILQVLAEENELPQMKKENEVEILRMKMNGWNSLFHIAADFFQGALRTDEFKTRGSAAETDRSRTRP